MGADKSKKLENKIKDYTRLVVSLSVILSVHRHKKMYENSLGEQVSLGVILSANHGFMSPDYKEVFDTCMMHDASDQDKFLINDDLVEDENHYYHHKADTMKSQKNLLFKRSLNGGKCSL